MNIVYNNYFSGSVLQISRCLEIIIYNKYDFDDRISLYNIESFCLKNLSGTSSEKFAKIYRQEGNAETPFEYKKLLEGGFNVIVYISNASSVPVGYTEFVNTQGVGVFLDIFLEVGREYEGELGIIIQNQLAGKNLSRRFQGKEIYNYSTLKDIQERKYRNLFTSDVGRTESDIYSFILNGTGIITSEESWKIKFRRGVTINPDLTNYNICFYSGSLILAAWEDKSYSLYPLLDQADTISGSSGSVIKKIVGRYYIDTENNLRDLMSEEIIEKTRKTQFCDYLDQKCKVYNLPTFYTVSSIFKYIPEINNIYLDLDNYLKSSSLVVHSKIGSWFILQRDFGGAYIYTAVSPTSVINMTEEDLENAIFVGDQTMILYDSGDSIHTPYYIIYNSFGIELSTEKAREILLNGRLGWWKETGNLEDEFFRFCYLDIEEEDEAHFEEYFGDKGFVHVVHQYEDLENTELSKYRKNIYPKQQDNPIPKLIGSYGGLIFYRDGTEISYL